MASEPAARVPEAKRIQIALRQQIVEGQRVPGTPLVERSIGEEFGVSRLPVRQAIQGLVAEQLVVPGGARSPATVRGFDDEELDALSVVHATLERLVIRWAAMRRTAEQVEALRLIVPETALDGPVDAAAMRRAVLEFRAYLFVMADSPILDELNQLVGARVTQVISHALEPAVAGHYLEALYRAIALGDAELAETVLGEYIAPGKFDSAKRA
ncbi:GntR family transcriptional regulator [Agromyces sp. NBRC 114283]|uniref:GntR family transcriptional regulator n=1 Tax=Agromyces sp. NBRC 114283 TaxID=2994521 RepID=UPI0024A0D330|nr:GntR family transcriptional regulator [Agromyces sp. NBRC 114283]GLU89576.1 transcriptional regulator [Agromyces sp. NBRC 114283]